ncbi:MAG: NAD(P)-binding domain-containing protein [Flavobacteriales bacterium]|nr:NAD(P)-binding domain-containing protein [Flavobacteriales bacterium]MBK6755615.1 NAD(P)-binding domain-containing protein [Flavobacteriales bacterium]MBK7083838.1 NAD(P)-binding domain-containing protein [Flavobacteriales bacterium]MBK7271485.1 NAD(P)-binding domain-containing protein [Flavobacteriales bacterium]MBK7754566.1 NAD(P)-binding domain-containing protein [Flavobacteriales bacterium]
MKIGVFGTGVVGQVIAEKLDSLGHEVMLGTREAKQSLAREGKDSYGRPPLKEWMGAHGKVKLGTFAEAAAHGQLLVNATSGFGAMEALQLAGEANLNGKTMLDISNPLDFSKGFPPSLSVCNTDSLGEQLQRAFPQLNVVKGLNTLTSFLMVAPRNLPEEHHIFLCGNDAGAKAEVRKLLSSFGWADNEMIDLGDITNARGTEQLLPIWVRLYGAFQNPMFNFKIVMAPKPA